MFAVGREPSEAARADVPEYTKHQQAAGATPLFSVRVTEPGAEWILCSGMYEWAADQLIERLSSSPRAWHHP